MVAANPITTEIVGTVRTVNGNGFRIAGREGWLNISRYAVPAPALPTVGQWVAAGLDKAGYVRSLAVGDGAVAAPPSAPPTPPAGAPSKDVQIARMNALGHAVAILSTHGEPVRYEDALAVAAALEAWIGR